MSRTQVSRKVARKESRKKTFGFILGQGGEGEVEAASLAGDSRALDPDASSHRLYQLLTDVKAQACPADGASKVPFQADKFPKEQRNIVRGNAGAAILHADGYL